MNLHFKNEDLYRCGLLSFDEYIQNNQSLLLKLRKSIFTEEESSILLGLPEIELDLDKFRFYVHILTMASN